MVELDFLTLKDSLEFKMAYWVKVLKELPADAKGTNIEKLFEEQRDQLKKLLEKLDKAEENNNVVYILTRDEEEKLFSEGY